MCWSWRPEASRAGIQGFRTGSQPTIQLGGKPMASEADFFAEREESEERDMQGLGLESSNARTTKL